MNTFMKIMAIIGMLSIFGSASVLIYVTVKNYLYKRKNENII